MTVVRKPNPHLWVREPHEHYVEQQWWYFRRFFEVERAAYGIPPAGGAAIYESARCEATPAA